MSLKQFGKISGIAFFVFGFLLVSAPPSTVVADDEIKALERKLELLKQKASRKAEYQKMLGMLEVKLQEIQDQIKMLNEEYKDVAKSAPAPAEPAPAEKEKASASGITGDFSVAHLGAEWKNGKSRVPRKGICKFRGGGGLSPELRVKNIPESTSAFLVSFTDRNWGAPGGHGIFKVPYDGSSKEFIIKSFPGEGGLPSEYKGIKQHHGRMATAGYYLGPCSGGRGHSYYVRVDALNNEHKRIARAQVDLGIF